MAPKLSELPEIFALLPHLSREDAQSFAKDIEEARNSLGGLPEYEWPDDEIEMKGPKTSK